MEPTCLLNSLQWAYRSWSKGGWACRHTWVRASVTVRQKLHVLSRPEDQWCLPTPRARGLHGRHRKLPTYMLSWEWQNVGQHVWQRPRGPSHHHSTDTATGHLWEALCFCVCSSALQYTNANGASAVFTNRKVNEGSFWKKQNLGGAKTAGQTQRPLKPRRSWTRTKGTKTEPVTNTAAQARGADWTADPGPTSHPNPTCQVRRRRASPSHYGPQV